MSGSRLSGHWRWPIARGLRGASRCARRALPLFGRPASSRGTGSYVTGLTLLRAECGCCPGDAEGFGMVFIEAQAMGLPVVSTLSGGIPEAVKNGETGLLVAERDPAALADGILRLMQDEKLWQQYSLRGQKIRCPPFQPGTANRSPRKSFRTSAGWPTQNRNGYAMVQLTEVLPSAPMATAHTGRRFYQPELDGLRFYAFLGVFICHTLPFDGALYRRFHLPIPWLWGAIAKSGARPASICSLP